MIKGKVIFYVLWFGVATGGGHLESGLVGQADTNLCKDKRVNNVRC